VKGWELKKSLGKDYMKIIEVLNAQLDKIGMEVKIAFERDRDLGKARFYVVLKEPLIEKASKERIDDLAALSAAIAYITARHDKAPRREVEQILKEKFPKWKVELNLDKFIKKGYLDQDEDILKIGWRTKIEVDRKELMRLLLG
jgi:hypothetical protein